MIIENITTSIYDNQYKNQKFFIRNVSNIDDGANDTIELEDNFSKSILKMEDIKINGDNKVIFNGNENIITTIATNIQHPWMLYDFGENIPLNNLIIECSDNTIKKITVFGIVVDDEYEEKYEEKYEEEYKNIGTASSSNSNIPSDSVYKISSSSGSNNNEGQITFKPSSQWKKESSIVTITGKGELSNPYNINVKMDINVLQPVDSSIPYGFNNNGDIIDAFFIKCTFDVSQNENAANDKLYCDISMNAYLFCDMIIIRSYNSANGEIPDKRKIKGGGGLSKPFINNSSNLYQKSFEPIEIDIAGISRVDVEFVYFVFLQENLYSNDYENNGKKKLEKDKMTNNRTKFYNNDRSRNFFEDDDIENIFVNWRKEYGWTNTDDNFRNISLSMYSAEKQLPIFLEANVYQNEPKKIIIKLGKSKVKKVPDYYSITKSSDNVLITIAAISYNTDKNTIEIILKDDSIEKGQELEVLYWWDHDKSNQYTLEAVNNNIFENITLVSANVIESSNNMIELTFDPTLSLPSQSSSQDLSLNFTINGNILTTDISSVLYNTNGNMIMELTKYITHDMSNINIEYKNISTLSSTINNMDISDNVHINIINNIKKGHFFRPYFDVSTLSLIHI